MSHCHGEYYDFLIFSQDPSNRSHQGAWRASSTPGAGRGTSTVNPERNIRNIRESSPFRGSIWDDCLYDQSTPLSYMMRCTTASSTYRSPRATCDRVTVPGSRSILLAPSSGSLNEQIGQSASQSPPPNPLYSLLSPTRLGRVWPFPLFLSFNTFTSLLHHDFLVVLNPFLCVEPSFSDILPITLPTTCHALFSPFLPSLPRPPRRVSARCSLP